MMTYEIILATICDIFADVLNSDYEQINPEMKLTGEIGSESLHMDSLEYVKILIAIEDKFQIVVDFEVYFDTIADLAHYILEEISIKNK